MVNANSKRKQEADNDSLILSRINTREASTLGFVSVAASASLVVLALAVGPNFDTYPYAWLIKWIGLASGILGFAYREITIWTIDRAEHDMLSSGLGRRIDSERADKRGLLGAFFRRLIVRSFLFLPILAWIAVIWKLANIYLEILVIIFLLAFANLSLAHLRPKT